MTQCPLLRRNVVEADKSILFTWRTEGTNPLFQQGDEITWSAHEEWFSNRITNLANLPFLAYERAGVVLSYCRIDVVQGTLRVSLMVSPVFRNQGIGKQVLADFLDYCRERVQSTEIYAVIHKLNAPSIRIFELCGFRFDIHLDEDFLQYVWNSGL